MLGLLDSKDAGIHEMTFTDEDLKRLKEWARIRCNHAEELHCTSCDIDALIARLEAAEGVIMATLELDDFIALERAPDLESYNRVVEKATGALKLWQKARGK